MLIDRAVLDEHGLRYDPEYLESEDYELWARLLAVADGDNLAEPLVLYRTHPGQASQRRRDVQRDFQRQVALREIERVAPDLPPDDRELAWRVGAGEDVDANSSTTPSRAYVQLVEAFERDGRLGEFASRRRGRSHEPLPPHRAQPASEPLRRALQLDPAMPLATALGRVRRDVRPSSRTPSGRGVAGARSDRARYASPLSSLSRLRIARRSSTASPLSTRSSSR